ncbi:MAG: response regulator [Eggerthellaceae bacterium]|nr:response regulator [Eggerthellaceae bacterium]
MAIEERELAETDKSIGAGAFLSNALAVLIILLLVAFFTLTVRNSAEVNQKVNTIENGTYVVSIEAGCVETGLVRLQTVAERPVYVRTAEAIDAVEGSYIAAYVETLHSVEYIHEHHINVDLRENLYSGYMDLADMFDEYLALCRDVEVTDAEVKSFYEEKINPKIDELLAVNVGIFEVSNARVEDLCADVDRLERQSIVMASILMIAVLVSLVVYLRLLHRNRKREEVLNVHLQDALDLAQAANRAKSTFLSNMSHDIRTPMNAIVGSTSIIEANIDDPHRVRESLDRIKVSSEHLLSLINDVLDMSKIESGKIILNEERFNLSDFMNGIEAIVQPHARSKNLLLETSISGVEKLLVIGDRLRLDQAVLNLLSNAIKYTPDGGAVCLSMTEEESERDEFRNYRIVVRDTGIGMAPGFIERIFEPFECERNTACSPTDGVGLGMPIVKNVIDMMGGTIEIDSVPGKGTAITIVVPLRIVEDVCGTHEAYMGDEAVKTAAAFEVSEHTGLLLGEVSGVCSKGRVLLVEDNPLNSEIATELIAMFGVEVDQAYDGQEAVESLINSPDGSYGLVFMDVQMPCMDGVEATRYITAHFEETGRRRPPIVAMTANAFDQDREQALAAGMDGFMAKPINLDELKHHLRHYLGPVC